MLRHESFQIICNIFESDITINVLNAIIRKIWIELGVVVVLEDAPGHHVMLDIDHLVNGKADSFEGSKIRPDASK